VAAALFGPLAVFPAMFAATAIGWLSIPVVVPNLIAYYQVVLEVAVYELFFAYLLTWSYGIPLYLILRRYGFEKLWAILSGALIPVFCFTVFRKDLWMIFTYFATWVSIASWLIAVWLPKHRNRLSERSELR